MKKLIFTLLVAGSSIYSSPQSLNQEFLKASWVKLAFVRRDETDDTERNIERLFRIADILLKQQTVLIRQVQNLTDQAIKINDTLKINQ